MHICPACKRKNVDYKSISHCKRCWPDKMKTYYQVHKNEWRKRGRRYRKSGLEKEWRTRYTRRARKRALETIAKEWGLPKPKCQIGLTPNVPTSDLPCLGQLQIDHINGGGGKERRRFGMVHLRINAGKRKLDDLRILCQLHQLWNQIRQEGR